MRNSILLICLVAFLSACQEKQTEKVSLAGEWQFKLDSTDVGISEEWFEQELPGKIQLPGTLDDAGIGEPAKNEPELTKEVLLGLTRKHDYVGPAWYSREIQTPEKWTGKRVELNLERVIWQTQVWVDGKKIGRGESLVAPHLFDLSTHLKPGQKQRLTIRVDNRKQYDISVNNLAHAYTNATQIIWNGITGDLSLNASDRVYIDNLRIFPDLERKKVELKFDVLNYSEEDFKGKIVAEVSSGREGISSRESVKQITISGKKQNVSLLVDMGEKVISWDEFDPHLYNLDLSVEGIGFQDKLSDTFGMRSLKRYGSKMMINGRPLFLRGTLECNIFPLEGYPPTSKKEWKDLMSTAREWGLNHLRFHSWCPPQAAFEVADEMGFYLQAELPYWNLNFGEDSATIRFLKEEADRMIDHYGNHPSFCFWSMGNEIQGDFEQLNVLVENLKEKDDRHLYCATSFTFESGHGKSPEPYDDFFVTQYTDSGWVRGQGVFNVEYPSFNKDYEKAVQHLDVPLITHEIGQYSVFPNPDEAQKYTGNLLPLNFQAIGNDLEEKGLIDQAEDFHKATGAFAALLYKEEIERALKTKSVSGFQLLDLHDFPGQGTALVGLLDAFWDSKGAIKAEGFRQFCSPVVPLLNFPKAVFENDELFIATPQIVNYGASSLNEKAAFRVYGENGDLLYENELGEREISVGNHILNDTLKFSLKDIDKAENLEVELKYGENINRWNIWVYPKKEIKIPSSVFFTRSYSEAQKALQQGRKVLFNPEISEIKGIKGMFVPVFWSPVHFPNQPGTMGLLVDTAHHAFQDFPTSFHSDWQWWDLCKQSRTLELPYDFGGNIVVQVVDNFAKNRLLADVFEANTGNGKLMFCSMDISSDLENRPVARQLRKSLLNYMAGDDFSPKGDVDLSQVEQFVKF